MKIFLGVDHQGVKYKELIINYLKEFEIEVIETQIKNHDGDDYPEFAFEVCNNVINNQDSLGILVCGTGIGMSIAANKVKGIRCARVVCENDAFLAKNHNGANVIAFGINIEEEEVKKIIDAFIATKSANEERHLRRINEIIKVEGSE